MSLDRLVTVDAKTTRQWIAEKKALLIDIRESDEYIGAHIPEARLVPLAALNRMDFRKDQGKIAVFYCTYGARTNTAAKTLQSTGFVQVYQLQGGLQGWRSAGYPVNENPRLPMSLSRQVKISTGLILMLGVLLTVLLSPWFHLLSAGVGAVLLHSGVTDRCTITRALLRMPWNGEISGRMEQPAI